MNTQDNSDNLETTPETQQPKRGRGRPKGSKLVPLPPTSIEEMMVKPRGRRATVMDPVLKRTKIEMHWERIKKAAANGYSYLEICETLNIANRTFFLYLSNNPEKKAELDRSKFEVRDEMLDVILNAARKGNWIPAAWFLERVFPHTFAKPEVKLQMYDRMINNDIVQQQIGGKSVDQIAAELKEKFGDNENVRRFFDAKEGPGSGANGDNGGAGIPQPEQVGKDQNS